MEITSPWSKVNIVHHVMYVSMAIDYFGITAYVYMQLY
jgi:hypothetical protein